MRMILTLSFWVCFFSLKFGCPLTFPFNVIVFLCLSLCLHMLSMYVWFCPHHDNPSLPAEGKLRRSYNAGPPVALSLAPFIYFFFSFIFPPSLSISGYYHSNSTEEIEVVCVCVCAFVCCMGSTKGTLGGEKGIGHKNKGQRKEGIFYFFRMMLRASSTQSLCGCGCPA